jgi:hypothetical protein
LETNVKKASACKKQISTPEKVLVVFENLDDFDLENHNQLEFLYILIKDLEIY